MSKAKLHSDVVDLTASGALPTTDYLEIVDLEIVDDPHLDGVIAPWMPPTNWRYSGWRIAVKRLIDIVGGLTLILVLLPVLAVVALAVRLSSRGAAIFAQERIGLEGSSFRMLKFRTMHIDADQRLRSDPEMWNIYVANDYKLPAESDPRLTPIGNLLRKTSLDELPQLLNVVAGTMSMVGPRPVVLPEYDHYRRTDSYQWLKPGATGPWQVSGRCTVSYPERSHIVDDYAEAWSLMSDIKILLKTIPTVFGRRGAH